MDNFCCCGSPWCPDIRKLRAYHAAQDREYRRGIAEHARRYEQKCEDERRVEDERLLRNERRRERRRENKRQLVQEARLLLASETTGHLDKLDKLLRS